MGILASEKYKIAFYVPHKGGQYTISTWIMNAQSNDKVYEPSYYTHLIPKPKNLSEYKKYLILRNPYKKFISGFLQEAISNHNAQYKQLNLTFLEFCRVIKTQLTNKKISRHKLKYNNTQISLFHMTPISRELKLQKYNKSNFAKVIFTEQLSDLLTHLNKKLGINVPVVAGNKKNYNDDAIIDIINTKVSDIANGTPYPSYKKWYNGEIKEIVDQFFKDDFELLKKYKMEVESPI
jgi:Sulfotransferase family